MFRCRPHLALVVAAALGALVLPLVPALGAGGDAAPSGGAPTSATTADWVDGEPVTLRSRVAAGAPASADRRLDPPGARGPWGVAALLMAAVAAVARSAGRSGPLRVPAHPRRAVRRVVGARRGPPLPVLA